MDCWSVLNIERFSDKKTIKIAYAKQLKNHRPDDDPEGFQQLHRAYKAALSWIPEMLDDRSEWMKLEAEPSDEALKAVMVESLKRPYNEIAINTSNKHLLDETEKQSALADVADDPFQGLEEISPPKLSVEDQQLLEEIQGQESRLNSDWQTLYRKTGELIKSKQRCNDLEQWKFLESLLSMNDLEFRKAASDQVFGVVSEVNSVSLENRDLYIKRPVLNYLNEQFAWDKKWQEYQSSHSRKLLNAVYPYLEEADKPVKGISKKRELFYYRRGAAFAIDLSIISIPFIIYAILNGLLVPYGEESGMQRLGIDGSSAFLIWILFYFLILIPIQESSKYQATLGKHLLQLQVIDKRGDRIGFFQAFWRSLVTMICCIGVKVVVFINFALSYWRSEILQDTLSRSYVVLRPGA